MHIYLCIYRHKHTHTHTHRKAGNLIGEQKCDEYCRAYGATIYNAGFGLTTGFIGYSYGYT
jgi:hypothetical protein